MLARILSRQLRTTAAFVAKALPPRRRSTTLEAAVAPVVPDVVSGSRRARVVPPVRATASAPATPPKPGDDSAALKKKAAKLARQLNTLYPNPPIPLDHESPFQLLVAVVLSAQTTDKKVNQVTPRLFDIAPDAVSMAKLDTATIQDVIKEIGLAKTKAANLSKTAAMLVEKHGGQVPNTFEELEALAGVGHKTASVVMAQAFGHPSFPVDTHIHRLAQRWGLTDGKNVVQTENDLKAVFPESVWNDIHLQFIFFGREHCPAQRHDPTGCPICSWAAVPPYNQPGFSPLKAGQSPGAPGKRKAAPPVADVVLKPAGTRAVKSKFFPDESPEKPKSKSNKRKRPAAT
eukprot:CAMPEP_0177771426 /NCGR_PEP_ID=MMETSP0491_2-20121128/11578_1 /TAXON_ID=63592 /ORGANISM="Tetraselmis chuii, Strain PLY429" /LENGTH=345 /DNA_ID=CAMNT_0019288959 /DNA_START=133 /DNA_END=1170 /DNA_ORIENTATION=-